MAGSGEAHDFRSDGIKRQDAVSQARIRHRPWHAPYGAARLVLRQHDAPVLRKSRQPASPSDPIPVSTTASTLPAYTAAAERNKPSTAGRQWFSSGAWVRCRVAAAEGDAPARTSICQFPRATKIVPGFTGSPSAASRTLSRQRPFSRSARIPVKSSGMCWTTSTGKGKVGGRTGSTRPAPPGRRLKPRWRQLSVRSRRRGRRKNLSSPKRWILVARNPGLRRNHAPRKRLDLGNQFLRQRLDRLLASWTDWRAWRRSPTPRRPALQWLPARRAGSANCT